jgi:uncharacterized membrane-anchored protein YhcB (DUF1043 family)
MISTAKERGNMGTLASIVLAAILLVCFGMLIGCTFSNLLLAVRDRQQAAVQRSLNEQWQELEAARQEIAQQRRGEPRKPVSR